MDLAQCSIFKRLMIQKRVDYMAAKSSEKLTLLPLYLGDARLYTAGRLAAIQDMKRRKLSNVTGTEKELRPD